jgi:tetratricopeptide (TPR) repeat protein
MPSETKIPGADPKAVFGADHRYDFFLSFSGTDKRLAKRAKEHLTQLGYKVCYQDEDFELGKSFVTSMDEAHLQSRRVIALFTPRYLATSPHTRLEFEAALVDGKLLIFRFDGAAIPPSASTQVRLDFPDELTSSTSLLLLQTGAKLQPARGTSRARRIHLAGLPNWQGGGSQSGQVLIGRDNELHQLDDALKNQLTKIVCVTAGGGFGKSALVKEWLKSQAEHEYGENVKSVYGYSFYKQGFEEGSAGPVRPFFEDLLLKLTDCSAAELEKLPEPELVRQALAHLRANPTLIVLDGLEPNQSPQHTDNAGDILQPLLAEFIGELRNLSGEGLCVITSRLMPRLIVGKGTVQIKLQALDHASSVKAFVSAGLPKDYPELGAWATKSEGHPLLISLLAPAVAEGHYDPQMFSIDQVLTEHNTKNIPKTVQNVVATRLAQLGQQAQAVMYCMALYGHAVSYKEIREEVVDRKRIPLFTAALYNIRDRTRSSSEMHFKHGVDALKKAAMITANGHTQSADNWVLEAHPLVQAGVRCHVQENHLALWRQANWTIFKSKCDGVKPKKPELAEDLRKLYAAVPHGVEAGRGKTAGWMYANRCLRGFRAYSTNRGMVADDVALISNYFRGNWEGIREDIGLNSFAKIQANAWAGAVLIAVNRAKDGIPRMQTGLDMAREARSFTTAARTGRILGVLFAMRGDLPKGESYLRAALIDLGRRSAWKSRLIDWKLVDRQFQRMATQTLLASILHQQARFQEAEASFQTAETITREATRFTGLRNVWCYYKVNFLYDLERFDDARAELAAASVDPGEPSGWGEGVFADVVLQLARLRGAVREADFLGKTPDQSVLNEGEIALKRLEMDQGFRMDWLQPAAKIAIAGKSRLTGAYQRAESALDEAQGLIDRSENIIFQVDLLMERTRLYIALEQPAQAQETIQAASEMAERLGYACRSKEVRRLLQMCK